MNYPPAPKLPFRLLRLFCIPDYYIDIEGDLLELYQRRIASVGSRKAKWLLYKDVFQLFRPGMIRTAHLPFQTSIMLKNNLIFTLRKFNRNKTSFLINLIGLSTGLACTLLIYLWIHEETSMDKFHENDAQLYQVVQNYDRKDGIRTRDITPAYFAKNLKETLPEVEYATPVNNEYTFQEAGILKVDDKGVKGKAIFAGNDFFKVFSFPLSQGNIDAALADKNGVVLSASLAQKLFDTKENVVGKTIEWEHDVFQGVYQVSGVFDDIPSSSTLQFDLVMNFELALDPYEEARIWWSDPAKTFFTLKEGTDLSSMDEKLTQILHAQPYRENCRLFAQPFSDRYLYGQYENGQVAGGRIAYVKLFSLIALFILIIACFNFMNLSTARASNRMKEVGVKKATGATRGILITQFLGESIVMVTLSAIIALLLISAVLPQFNTITGRALDLAISWQEAGVFLGIILATGLIAGSYPAFYLSSFEPVAVLKGKLNTSWGEKWIRKGLVTFQFTLSVLFIVGFVIINQQIAFIQEQNLGYNKDNVITFVSMGKGSEEVEAYMARLRQTPGVLSATNIYGGNFIGNRNFGTAPTPEGKEGIEALVPRPHVGLGYLETLGIELIEGRSFSAEFANEEDKVILNEAAVKMVGYDNPVGKYLKRGPDYRIEIIGVVKDYHTESMHEVLKPSFIRYLPDGKNIMVKVRAGEEKATLAALKTSYEAAHPGFPFQYSYLDKDYQRLYETENRISMLSNYFAGIAIIISCLGLLGLAVFTAEQRRKEIGIRKVLGSSVLGIVKMLTSDFTKTVFVAIVIALPLSYWLADYWLTSFAYRMELQWGLFLAIGLAVLAIAWLTVGIQTMRAAQINPVECLRE